MSLETREIKLFLAGYDGILFLSVDEVVTVWLCLTLVFYGTVCVVLVSLFSCIECGQKVAMLPVAAPADKFQCQVRLLEDLVAQCSATPATVAATPPCSATPFQTQISVRHLPAQGGGKVRHLNF